MRCKPRLILLAMALLGLLALPLVIGGASAEEKKTEPAIELPMVFCKPAPENARDLKDIEKHVSALVKKLQPAVVCLQIGAASGSGVIVSKEGYVLTAAHVSGTAGREGIAIILPDGRRVKGKTLGRNSNIDSGMVQIIDKGEYPFLDMGNSGDLKKGDWCLAIGHPGGLKKGRPPVVRLGRILDNGKTVIRTDAALVGGDSGGPLFDMRGKVIGIHSRIGPSMNLNMHVPVDTYRDTWDKLVKAEEWGTGLFGGRPKQPPAPKVDVYMGMQLDFNKDKAGKIKAIEANSPADKAGLKVDDIIAQIDGKSFADQVQLNDFLLKKRPNDEITLAVRRGEDNLTIKLKLEKIQGK
jgi:serine protease Do